MLDKYSLLFYSIGKITFLSVVYYSMFISIILINSRGSDAWTVRIENLIFIYNLIHVLAFDAHVDRTCHIRSQLHTVV
jgi:hypothetical protein